VLEADVVEAGVAGGGEAFCCFAADGADGRSDVVESCE
jgi:hypothetical protein